MLSAKRQWHYSLMAMSCVTMLALSGCGLKDSSDSATSSLTQSVVAENPDIQKLLGTWEAEAEEAQETGKMIFAPEGILYLFISPSEALEGTYTIDSTTQPKHLNISFGEAEQVISTIFEFPDTDRLQFANSSPGEPRPTEFGNRTLRLRKTAEVATLPQNVVVVSSDDIETEEKTAKQSEGKTNVGAMNRAQQAFFLEESQFTDALDELGIGIAPETETYKYNLVVIEEGKLVQTLATSKKEGLKSYTGIVFATDESQGKMSQTLLCESDEPTQATPPQPNTEEGAIACPSGYTSLK
ncbi:type IV pilin-like G/H family protein [Lusitaniella coriacea]|nr:type IV pilin-like G/H family protein [Lusitaniella coriacea]